MKTKIAILAAILATGIVAPAFANSSNDDQTTAAKLDEVGYVINQDQPTAAKLDEATYRSNDDQTTAAKLDEATYRSNDDQTTAAKLDEVTYRSNDDQTTAAKLDEVVFRAGTFNAATMTPRLVDWSDNPGRTGGGSYGYNNQVHHDYI
jgi:hypothetical protein